MPTLAQVRDYLARFDLKVLEYEQPTPTVADAARVVGCSEAEIGKTLLFRIGETPVAVLAAGDRKVASSRLKAAAGLSGKVRMVPPEQVEELVGYPPGGVCPFLLPESLPLLLDASLRRFRVVYPAAGTRASAVAVPVAWLEQVTGGRWVELDPAENHG